MREQLILKVWVNMMPGEERLARQLGIGRMTIEAAA
jgi:DNA-binding GntR family transcriptional regulator